MKSIRIGTRKSPLALWQAREVARSLQNANHITDIIPIVSSGDKNLVQPLYELGITGIFTRDLDIALLNGEIDIAVHSLKDIPTLLPENLKIIAYLERDFPQDVLVRSSRAKDKPLHELKVATSSLRRRAFWLKEFPDAEFENIRGNVHTRLEKLESGIADATILSLAGIKRLQLNIDYEPIPFMIPAPSQGIVAVVGKTENEEINRILKEISDENTELCATAERAFLNKLEGGCTAPIGAFAEITGEKMRFVGRLSSPDGKNTIETDEILDVKQDINIGATLAKHVLENGGKEIMEKVKKHL